jgi:hypothetical protein
MGINASNAVTGSFRMWLSRDAANFIAAVSNKFGVPSSPIILRSAVGAPAS